MIEQRKRGCGLDLSAEQPQGQRRAKLVSADISGGNGHGDRKIRDQQDHQTCSERRRCSDRVQHQLNGNEIAEPRGENARQGERYWAPEIENAEPREERQLAPARVSAHQRDRQDRRDRHAREPKQPRANGDRELRNEPRQRRRQHHQSCHVSQLLQTGDGQSHRERHAMAPPQDPEAKCLSRPRRRQNGADRRGQCITQQRPKRHRAQRGQSEAPECGFPGEPQEGDGRNSQQRERFGLGQGTAQLRDVELGRPKDKRDTKAARVDDLQGEPPGCRSNPWRGVCDFVVDELSHGRQDPFRQWPPPQIERSMAIP